MEGARKVLDNLTPVQREARNGGGRHFMRRITPFRTSDNKIEGVVIMYSDVTRLKEASARIEFRARQQAVTAHLGTVALASDDLEALFEQTVREVAKTLDVEFAKILEFRPDTKTLRLAAAVGFSDSAMRQPIPAGIGSQAGYTLRVRP